MNLAHRTVRSPLRRAASFALCNGILFAAFSVLWVMDYDLINNIVVPWGWLAGFFIVSFCHVRGRVALPIVFSAYLAVLFSALLCFFVILFLAPIYDPWF